MNLIDISTIYTNPLYEATKNMIDNLAPESKDKYNKKLKEVINKRREEIKSECGFIFPEIYVREVCNLQENEFVIFIRNNMVANGFLIPNKDGITDEFYDVFKTALYNSFCLRKKENGRSHPKVRKP